jgi:circadian clock protein KaiB
MSRLQTQKVPARPTIELRLYVAGDAPNSITARANLRLALARDPATVVRLEIVDVLADPERGLRDGVVLTPMLVRVTPVPSRRVVGTLRNEAALLSVIDLRDAL